MTEVWRDVVGYEGVYQVSNQGRVKSKKRRRLLRPNRKKSGYTHVTLSKAGVAKVYLLHRLVAMAFLPNPDSLMQVNHKNGIKQDNRVTNLEWCSPKENIQHRYKVLGHKGKPKPVQCIETGDVYPAIYVAADALGVHKTSLSMVLNGKRKTAGGLHFKFYN